MLGGISKINIREYMYLTNQEWLRGVGCRGMTCSQKFFALVEFDTRAGSAEVHWCGKVERNRYPGYWVWKVFENLTLAYDIQI